jgi:hypothetical protein
VIDWERIPVVDVPIARFAVRLHDIAPDEPDKGPVHAFTRYGPDHDVWTADGRHRVLRALLRGDETVPARLLVLP